MKFNAWSKKRIKEGRKFLTSRKEPHYDDEHILEVLPHPLPWWFIKRYLWRDEGADSPEELQKVINQIFRRKVKNEEMFYVHVLNIQKFMFL